jgi:hypothetical protein
MQGLCDGAPDSEGDAESVDTHGKTSYLLTAAGRDAVSFRDRIEMLSEAGYGKKGVHSTLVIYSFERTPIVTRLQWPPPICRRGGRCQIQQTLRIPALAAEIQRSKPEDASKRLRPIQDRTCISEWPVWNCVRTDGGTWAEGITRPSATVHPDSLPKRHSIAQDMLYCYPAHRLLIRIQTFRYSDNFRYSES